MYTCKTEVAFYVKMIFREKLKLEKKVFHAYVP